MTPEEIVRFPSGDDMLTGGLTKTSKSAPVVIVCHPHPDYGGSMDNNVVYAVRDGLVSVGMSVLRFNLRGVGGSTGRSTGDLTDSRDVGAAVDFIKDRGEEFGPLYLVGYSYGAWIGLYHGMTDARVDRLVGITPPLLMFDFSYLVDVHSPALAGKMPIFFVAGDRDSFSSLEKLDDIIVRIGEPKKTIINGADHFYVGYEGEMARSVVDFLVSGDFNVS